MKGYDIYKLSTGWVWSASHIVSLIYKGGDTAQSVSDNSKLALGLQGRLEVNVYKWILQVNKVIKYLLFQVFFNS